MPVLPTIQSFPTPVTMKRTLTIFALVILSLLSQSVAAQQAFNTQLAKQIDSLRDEDQKPAALPSDQAEAAFKAATRRNFTQVKNILDVHGFPGYDLVGKTSSQNFWMLVQHSDFDVPFQKRALELMKKEVDKGNASGQYYGYLIDRISINEGKPQVYGTQVNMSPNGTTIKPTIDTLNLDARRLAIGMTTIKAYLQQCDEAYLELNKKNRPKAATDSTKKVN